MSFHSVSAENRKSTLGNQSKLLKEPFLYNMGVETVELDRKFWLFFGYLGTVFDSANLGFMNF